MHQCIDQYMDMVLVILVAVPLLFVLIYWHLHGKQDDLPPGPWTLPLIGNLHQLIGRQPHLAITRLSQKHGTLMSLRLGTVFAVVVSSAEMAKLFLQTHDRTFASRPEVSNARVLTYGFLDMMWAPYGQHWRELRRVCVLELFTVKRVELFQRVRREEMVKLMHRLLAAAEEKQVVNMKQRLAELVWSLISRMVSNRGSTVDIDQGLKAKSTIEKALKLAGAFNVSECVSLFKGVDIQGFNKQVTSCHAELDAYFQSLLELHRQQKRPADESEDFLDVLTSIQKQQGEEFMSDEKIKAIVQDIFAAGTDTSSLAIEWALTELIRHPQVLQKAQEELLHVVGEGRMVVEADLPQLNYLHAVVKETLRLHPPGPLFQHYSLEQCEVSGYVLPAGTRVIINFYGISRDSASWEEPLTFKPERFTDRPWLDVKGHDFEFIPFGSGRRICPGLALGVRIVEFALAQLIHCFNWRTHEIPDVEEVCGMTLWKAKPLLASPSPRLHVHAYKI